MICIGFMHSNVDIAALMFYTCIWLPLLKITNTFKSIIGFSTSTTLLYHQVESTHLLETSSLINNLPISKFGDSEVKEEMCSVCLMEFAMEDQVNQLPSCGHVFHCKCIRKWIDRCRFSCPLCRSVFLDMDSCYAAGGFLHL